MDEQEKCEHCGGEVIEYTTFCSCNGAAMPIRRKRCSVCRKEPSDEKK